MWTTAQALPHFPMFGRTRPDLGNSPVTGNCSESRRAWIMLYAVSDMLLIHCIYSYRTATKCCRNLRFRPQFCEGFDSNPQKPVRALGAPLGLGCSCQLHPPQHVSAKPVAWKLRILLSAR